MIPSKVHLQYLSVSWPLRSKGGIGVFAPSPRKDTQESLRSDSRTPHWWAQLALQYCPHGSKLGGASMTLQKRHMPESLAKSLVGECHLLSLQSEQVKEWNRMKWGNCRENLPRLHQDLQPWHHRFPPETIYKMFAVFSPHISLPKIQGFLVFKFYIRYARSSLAHCEKENIGRIVSRGKQ